MCGCWAQERQWKRSVILLRGFHKSPTFNFIHLCAGRLVELLCPAICPLTAAYRRASIVARSTKWRSSIDPEWCRAKDSSMTLLAKLCRTSGNSAPERLSTGEGRSDSVLLDHFQYPQPRGREREKALNAVSVTMKSHSCAFNCWVVNALQLCTPSWLKVFTSTSVYAFRQILGQ